MCICEKSFDVQFTCETFPIEISLHMLLEESKNFLSSRNSHFKRRHRGFNWCKCYRNLFASDDAFLSPFSSTSPIVQVVVDQFKKVFNADGAGFNENHSSLDFRNDFSSYT